MENTIIQQASQELKSRYDYISKLDGMKYLKGFFGSMITLRQARDAWNIAYND